MVYVRKKINSNDVADGNDRKGLKAGGVKT